MNKKLKFAQTLVPLILNHEKTSTWRLWDDKNLTEGDVVDFIEYGTLRHFATAKLTKVIEKTMGTLTPDDKKGHEKFANDEVMFKAYAEYYAKSVDKDTPVKLIWFIIK